MKTFILKADTDKQQVVNYIQAVNIEKPVSVSVKPYKPNRSLSQNKLYWKWLNIMGDDLGYAADDLHAILAAKFLGMQIKEALGNKVPQPISTASLNVKEFAVYLTKIEVFSNAELGIRLPNNDDLYFESLGIKK